MKKKLRYGLFILIIGLFSSMTAAASLMAALQRLPALYPDDIQTISLQQITWKDGENMPVGEETSIDSKNLDESSLATQLTDRYIPGKPANIATFIPTGDPGRIRYQPFFQKMYGHTRAEIEKNLVTIYWMPKIFRDRYPLKVTTVNDVHKRLIQISHELEKLPNAYYKFLADPGGTYVWRDIAYTTRLSPHSFGMAIDINTDHAQYWQWDLTQQHRPITENEPLSYHNKIPWEIVLIFEKYGFIWGGKWQHYDTMHFEYRPEIFSDISVIIPLRSLTRDHLLELFHRVH